jgi:hypothetical protein
MDLFLDIWYSCLDAGSARRKATTYTGQHNTEKGGQTFMPRAGFEPKIPVFELLKTVRALDSAAIGTGIYWEMRFNLKQVSTLSDVTDSLKWYIC